MPGWYALRTDGADRWLSGQAGIAQQKGQDHIALGMVLGARELVCASGRFAKDATLDITVRLLMQDERFGSFECTISSGEETLATGRVNTFQPSAEELTSLFNQGSHA